MWRDEETGTFYGERSFNYRPVCRRNKVGGRLQRFLEYVWMALFRW